MNNQKEATMRSIAQQGKKQPYEKPRLRAIDLAGDEVLATGCKTVSQTASNNVPQCGLANNCVLTGS